jgi:hypothetical protein
MTHAFLIVLVEIHFVMASSSRNSFWVSRLSDPSFQMRVDHGNEKVDHHNGIELKTL